MLMPKKVKFRKQQRGRMTGKAWRGSSLAFGDYGLKAMECGWITSRQIEAARVAMTRSIKRGGKVWIRLFPDKARALDDAEIQKHLRDQQEQAFRLRFQMSMGQTDGLKKLRGMRKERA